MYTELQSEKSRAEANFGDLVLNMEIISNINIYIYIYIRLKLLGIEG
jgi:hypothetical protein